jgi:hypothetical protein
LDYILRHTWGYQKSSDKISISQFKNGIVNKRTGEVVDRGIGIKKRDSILNAIKRLEKLGFVKVFQVSGKTKEISLVTNGDQPSHQRGLVASHQRGHTIDNVTINNRQYRSSSKKKPYYDGMPVVYKKEKGQEKCYCIAEDGRWLEFAGKEEDITYN